MGQRSKWDGFATTDPPAIDVLGPGACWKPIALFLSRSWGSPSSMSTVGNPSAFCPGPKMLRSMQSGAWAPEQPICSKDPWPPLPGHGTGSSALVEPSPGFGSLGQAIPTDPLYRANLFKGDLYTLAPAALPKESVVALLTRPWGQHGQIVEDRTSSLFSGAPSLLLRTKWCVQRKGMVRLWAVPSPRAAAQGS